MLKEGDVVVCVDNSTYEDVLTTGKMYVVRTGAYDRAFSLVSILGDTQKEVRCSQKRFKLYNPVFEGMKFRVKDEEHSKLIQEHLFSLGYGWEGRGFGVLEKVVKHTSHAFLYTYSNKQICYGDDIENFETKDFPEIELVATTTYSLKPVEKEEFVELNGKKYNKKDLEEALSKLHPVDD